MKAFRLGTRSSKLALAQANLVKQAILAVDSSISVEIVSMLTQGDQQATVPLADIGGKGVFIKTLEQALLAGHIDAAVHSVKDMTAQLHPDTEIAAYLEAESAFDCFVFKDFKRYSSLADIPKNITCATSSLRRQAILKHFRPDIQVKPIRGNIDTRIQLCQTGYADAVLLSTVGLIRLDRYRDIGLICDHTQFIPAPGQGVMGVQVCRDRYSDFSFLADIDHQKQRACSVFERQLLAEIGFDCNDPLGIYVQINDQAIELHVCWSDKQLSRYFHKKIVGEVHRIDLKQIATDIKQSLQG